MFERLRRSLSGGSRGSSASTRPTLPEGPPAREESDPEDPEAVAERDDDAPATTEFPASEPPTTESKITDSGSASEPAANVSPEAQEKGDSQPDSKPVKAKSKSASKDTKKSKSKPKRTREPAPFEATERRRRSPKPKRPATTASDPAPNAPAPLFSGPRPASEIAFLRSMRAHWVVVLATLAVFIAGAVAVALVRQPVYTSQVSLNVSFTADSVATQPGAVSAAQDLAESYARSLYSTKIINRVARQTELGRDDVTDSISASPVGDSTVFFVSAEGSTEAQARNIADTTARAFVDYVDELGTDELQASGLQRRYREAARRFEELAEDARNSGGEALVDIKAEQAEVALERDTYAQLYRGTQRPVVAPVEILDDSRGATSDFLPRLQLLVLAGLIGGLLAGAALANLRAARVRRRSEKPTG